MNTLIAEILATGDEIRCGALVDSNTGHIAERLEQEGVFVRRHLTVGDDLRILVDVFGEIAARADVCVVTGGLGPTEDDLTAEAAARAAGVGRVPDPVALAAIEAFFRLRNRPVSESNRKQALLPEGSERLDNPIGTAPGFALSIDRCRFFCLPGVPAEMRRMLDEQVLSRIRDLQGPRKTFATVRSITTFGLPESTVGDRLEGFAGAFPAIRIGFRAKFPEIHVRLYARDEDADRMADTLDRATAWVRSRLDIHVVSETGASLEQVVGELLRGRGATVALAESCTGGLVAHRLTEVPGSSAYFLLSAVTYANAAKVAVLGVSETTLNTFGAVSEETVSEMAAGVRRLARADYGLAVSGIAGPDGATAGKPVGTVCIGLAGREGVKAYRYLFSFGARRTNKRMFAAAALDLLRRSLLRGAGN